MSKIRHILLIPAEGDPHGLLREGPCFAAPPVAVWSNVDARWDEAPPHTRAIYRDGHPKRTTALVLAWGGEAVPEGCDRVGRLVNTLLGEESYSVPTDPNIDSAHTVAMDAEQHELGRLVVVCCAVDQP